MGLLGVEPSPDGVWVLTLDNEPRRNAVDPPMLQALERVCAEASAQGARCLVLTGKGERAFCAGYDLTTLKEAAPEEPLPDVLLHLAAAALERARPPVIAALNGVAIGAGGELAMACDLRVAAANARISMPPARLGIVYSPAGLQRFVELCGLSHAKRLFFTGDAAGAEEARQIGLVDEVVPEGQALARALELARQIAANAPLAVQGMKRLFALMRRRELPEEARAEAEALRRGSFASEDAREGLAAVLEKRSPVFRGR